MKLKWLVWAGVGVLAASAAVAGAIVVYAPVDIPLRGLVANLLPRWLEAPRADSTVVQSRLKAPAGYRITLFAADLADARMLRVTAAGDVLVSSMRPGKVLLLKADHNGDGVSDGRDTILTGLEGPNGLEIANGYLYVAESGRVLRVAFDDSLGRVQGPPEIFIDGLPSGGNHWKKTIRFGPDGLLYVAVGSSCNVCLEEDPRRAAMLRYTPDGKFVGIYATGLRNAAGFDWRDEDGGLYATENGRDLLGDDFPPCELNRIVEGGFYGWPFANGSRIADPDFGEGHEVLVASSIPPLHEFRPHNAPLGIVFLRSGAHPAGYRGAALVALHGSWNRRQRDGYKVVSLHWAADGSIEARDFVTGFLDQGEVIGRPVEVAEDRAGHVYVSDDYANAVYRIAPLTAASH